MVISVFSKEQDGEKPNKWLSFPSGSQILLHTGITWGSLQTTEPSFTCIYSDLMKNTDVQYNQHKIN